MAIAATAMPLSVADTSTRVAYLQRVLAITVLGLTIAAVTGFASAGVIASTPGLQGRWTSMGVILGAYGVANFVAPSFVYSRNPGSQWAGFLLGSTFQGIAMGYLLLAAMIVSGANTGNPLLLIGEALGLTAMTALGLCAYVWSKPRELSLIRGMMSALFLPMLLLMVVSFVFPIGGPLGIALTGIFVVMSAAGLLYQMNKVLHELDTDMHVPGAYMITMGVLILFWNLLMLLMRLQDRR